MTLSVKGSTLKSRQYIQSRNIQREAVDRLADFDAILGRAKNEYDKLRASGIVCQAFQENGEIETIDVTRHCWNHLFKHPVKRPSKIEKLERAIVLPLAVKLLLRTTTYQEVSRDVDAGGNTWLYFGIIGYVRGVRMKVVIRAQEKITNAKKILFSFYQLSGSPQQDKKPRET